jgi:hypothetical protein
MYGTRKRSPFTIALSYGLIIGGTLILAYAFGLF